MRFDVLKTLKSVIKSLLFQTPKYYEYSYWNEYELRQKRVCEHWSIGMLAEYYEVTEHSMREVLDFYNIK